MKKGLIILSIIGAILVAVSLFFDFKAKSIKENLIKEYEQRIEDNTNEITKENEIITSKSQEQTSNTYKNKGNKNNNSATNNPGTIAILKISSINLKAPIVDGEE
ncbi:MAG: class D sortase, partial [Clostridium perfringens]|nr:class D sortase [Clostridium perfringens]